VGAAGWTAIADALEAVTSLTSLNGCDRYAAIRAGRQTELALCGEMELGVAVARYLPCSADSLTKLDLRCPRRPRAAIPSLARGADEARGGRAPPGPAHGMGEGRKQRVEAGDWRWAKGRIPPHMGQRTRLPHAHNDTHAGP
jgi:hypothetical protein